MVKDIITADLGGEALSAEALAAIPDFQSIRKELWSKFPGAVTRKVYEPGEIIVKEGDFGTTAFYLLSGEAEILLQSKLAALESRKRNDRRWFQRLTKISSLVSGKTGHTQSVRAERTHIPMDGSVDLPMDNPTAILRARQLLGAF